MENIVLLTNDLVVAEFTVDHDKKLLENVKIKNLPMAEIYYPNVENANYEEFENLMKVYMGGNFTLKEYMDHVRIHGFYTPYKPNLRIKNR